MINQTESDGEGSARKRPPEPSFLTPAEHARQDLENVSAFCRAPLRCARLTIRLVTLKMNNQTSRVLYESVGRLAGINVLFDPQVLKGKAVRAVALATSI